MEDSDSLDVHKKAITDELAKSKPRDSVLLPLFKSTYHERRFFIQNEATTVQQALRVQWGVFGVFLCFDLYFVNYRSWQAEILQERAEGCIQVDLQKKIRQDYNNAFLFCGFVGVVFGHKFKVV